MTVQVREAIADGDLAQWLSGIGERLHAPERELLSRALSLATRNYGDASAPDGQSLLIQCREIAGILSALRLDAETIAAGLLSGFPGRVSAWEELLKQQVGAPVASLVEGCARMGQIQSLRAHTQESKKAAERSAQLEAVRKMLLAMVQDVRVVLIKLAQQTQLLRYIAGRGDAELRDSAARDTLELFAPLANRLGVWQLKWELEDLAFRCQDPDTYKRIARELDEKRTDRETFIAEVIDTLRAELGKAGIRADVSGRPKHIYSIYKKLARKDRSLKELFDIRGVRVLVEDIKDCYTVLGLVHNVWTPLPREFDDYIAKPKPNNYRSLHTAVVGPDQKVLEVQIRTHEMHQHSEYGVAAHWRYKEGKGGADSSAGHTSQYNEKIAWLRQILDWKDGLADVADLAQYFRGELFEESVYVLTPQGRVIDLPKGATPVDFAYHVHSDLGHRCRGARVDGHMVPLNYALANGQMVEIVAAKTGGPSRDWINPELGFLHSPRARAKVRQWFNNQNLETAVAQGRQVVEKLLQRAGMTALALDVLAARLGFAKVDDFLVQVGRGEIGPRQIQSAIKPEPAAAASTTEEPELTLPSTTARPTEQARGGDILVVGVDKLLTVLAKCCKPAPPDAIVGFVTRGRGVTIHRQTCPNAARLASERLIAAQWGADAGHGHFSVDVEVEGVGDHSLARDVADVLSREKVRILQVKSHSDDVAARLLLTIEVNGLSQLTRLLGLVQELPRVATARRR